MSGLIWCHHNLFKIGFLSLFPLATLLYSDCLNEAFVASFVTVDDDSSPHSCVDLRMKANIC